MVVVVTCGVYVGFKPPHIVLKIILTASLCNDENPVYWLNSQLVKCAVFYAVEVALFTLFTVDNTGGVGRYLFIAHHLNVTR